MNGRMKRNAPTTRTPGPMYVSILDAMTTPAMADASPRGGEEGPRGGHKGRGRIPCE